MDIKKLIDPFPIKKEAELIAQSIAKEPKYIKELWQISISNEKNSWRATYLIGKVYNVDPDMVRPYIPKMIKIIPKLQDESKLREYLKLISFEPLTKDISGDFINRCFDLMVHVTTAVAVKVHAMQILFNFTKVEPDLQNELALIIEEQMEHGSAGFCSRGRKILSKMNRS